MRAAAAALDREEQRQLIGQRSASESARPPERADAIAPWRHEEPPLSLDVENFFTPASTMVGEDIEAEQFFVQDKASNQAVRTIPRQEQKGKSHLGDLSAESGLRPPSPSHSVDPSEWGRVSDSTFSSMKSWDKVSATVEFRTRCSQCQKLVSFGPEAVTTRCGKLVHNDLSPRSL